MRKTTKSPSSPTTRRSPPQSGQQAVPMEWLLLKQAEGGVPVSELCREHGMRIKPKKRLKRDKPEPLAVPDLPNDTWSIVARQAMHSIAERGFYGGSTC